VPAGVPFTHLALHLGFASQKARVVSGQLDEAKRLERCQQIWPAVLRCARKILLLFGDKASFAPWAR
jgi:hypothetical protein